MRVTLIVVTVAMVVMALLIILGLAMTTPPDFYIVWAVVGVVAVAGGSILVKVLME